MNRCLAEGRKRFFELYAEIEAGEACERAAPALASLARGEAGAATLLELRPHLRHCSACQATLRHLRRRRHRARGRVATAVPGAQPTAAAA